MKIIDPKYWGPYTWYVIHTMAYSYESDKKVNYERILNSLKEEDRKLDANIHKQMTEEFINFYRENISKKTQIIKGTEDFLKWGKSQNINFAICTNKMESLAIKLLKEINLFEFFDYIAGVDTFEYKKEMDDIKKKLEHAQTSIERTVVAKGTETADKVLDKVGDMAKNVVEPIASVMKDHYATVIDSQRKAM